MLDGWLIHLKASSKDGAFLLVFGEVAVATSVWSSFFILKRNRAVAGSTFGNDPLSTQHIGVWKTALSIIDKPNRHIHATRFNIALPYVLRLCFPPAVSV
jgi:hypothetical protein